VNPFRYSFYIAQLVKASSRRAASFFKKTNFDPVSFEAASKSNRSN